MKRWSRYLVPAAGLGILTLAVALAAGAAVTAEQTVKGVMTFIVNDSANPVPVKSVGGLVATQSSGRPFHVEISPVLPSIHTWYIVPPDTRALIRYVSGTSPEARLAAPYSISTRPSPAPRTSGPMSRSPSCPTGRGTPASLRPWMRMGGGSGEA